MSNWANREADFDGPVDEWGRPATGDEALDIEVRFRVNDSTLYRFTFESPTQQAYCGSWRESREQAYREGQQWMREGRL
jgi:hypothetical protein